MDYYYLTDPGKVRTHNEDSVIIVKNNTGEFLLAVADGMGGHKGGEIASSIAISHIGDKFKELDSIGTKDDAIDWIRKEVSEANRLIYEYTAQNPESQGMGTTLVLALLTHEFLIFGNIGDSSGYVYKDKMIHKVTTDHTLVNLLVKSGDLTPEEAKEHPRRNVLMRALGASTKVEMDIIDVETDVDGVFLCSDGLTNMLDDSQIAKVLSEKLTIEEKLNKLIIKSNNRGGTDNISVAFLDKEVK
ncbi:MAG: Stp1/IreP family PP2C-type Ser/Thr phosphatase [Clostridium sp.]|nr:Stp1/IreP family PP2C-type Ser/Thr phosphatase [Clostridium sp.]MCM1444641.1 Stp1/IreP family PP2C-type Ser/Thr phosphatase [Candidatus Amulumruptor caecigallinarius]